MTIFLRYENTGLLKAGDSKIEESEFIQHKWDRKSCLEGKITVNRIHAMRQEHHNGHGIRYQRWK